MLVISYSVSAVTPETILDLRLFIAAFILICLLSPTQIHVGTQRNEPGSE